MYKDIGIHRATDKCHHDDAKPIFINQQGEIYHVKCSSCGKELHTQLKELDKHKINTEYGNVMMIEHVTYELAVVLVEYKIRRKCRFCGDEECYCVSTNNFQKTEFYDAFSEVMQELKFRKFHYCDKGDCVISEFKTSRQGEFEEAEKIFGNDKERLAELFREILYCEAEILDRSCRI